MRVVLLNTAITSFLAIGGADVVYGKKKNKNITVNNPTLLKKFKKAAERTRVPLRHLLAVCYAESGLNPYAINEGDGGNKNHAVGVCQVLISTAGQYIRVDKSCGEYTEDTPLSDRVWKKCNLFGWYTNAYIAGRYLRYQYERYNSWSSAILAYNAGSVRPCPKSGKVHNVRGELLYRCTYGGPINQIYLDRVLNYYVRIQFSPT